MISLGRLLPERLLLALAVALAETIAAAQAPVAAEAADLLQVPGQLPDVMSLRLGFADVVRVQGTIGTIVLGSQDVVDAKMLDSSAIILTGVTAGTTNMIVLDQAGLVVAAYTLHVVSPRVGSVTVRRGMAVETYVCPDRICEAAPEGGTVAGPMVPQI